VKDYFQKEDVPQKDFFQDLGLLTIKKNTISVCGKYLVKTIGFTRVQN
jgi:hypothetical protein